ncbi:MAG: PTS sugar transporter subunit IIA [Erysipelotrichaceae bacterium]|nr:PTS sugar transporter subunit IIA [Erysipelotrichaceae bacterium]
MVGIIICGHGTFPLGMESAVELIAGKQEALVLVCFEHEPEQLEADLQKAIEALSGCERIIVFCDLPGGTPFKTAGIISAQREDMDVVAGVNLPMLCETVLARTFTDDPDALAENAVQTGKEQVLLLDLNVFMPDETEKDEGI